MNAHLAQIPEQHRIPLETAIAASIPGQHALVARLYKEAADMLNSEKIRETPGILKHRQSNVMAGTTTWAVTVSATDEATGYFISMNATFTHRTAPASYHEGPFLTFGRKFVQEHKPPQLNNTATKLWC
jgi:hypothetical protein